VLFVPFLLSLLFLAASVELVAIAPHLPSMLPRIR
jgi:hypothetical protein